MTGYLRWSFLTVACLSFVPMNESMLTAQMITTIAGGNGPNRVAATSIPLLVTYVAVDGSGNVYVAATAVNRVYKVATNGIATTVAGNGTYGYSGDNGPATSAQLSFTRAVTLDNAGNLYVADSNRVRKVSSGIITTVAGGGPPNGRRKRRYSVDH
jgi:hypothetical protein